jgi:hypothetical protein
MDLYEKSWFIFKGNQNSKWIKTLKKTQYIMGFQ